MTICANTTEQVREHRVLGITTDEEFNWQPRIDNNCKQVARNLFLLDQLRKCVDTDCRKLVFKTHLMAHINYASTVWSNARKVRFKEKLNSLHRRAAKLILPDRSLSATAKLKKLDILPLRGQFVYNTAVLTFKVHMGWAPQYVCDLLNRAPVRYESKKNYVLLRTRIDLCEVIFAFSESSVLNSLGLNSFINESISAYILSVKPVNLYETL